LGIGYPGGPLVDKLAQVGNPQAFSFTRARVKKGKYFFSFSGLKTAVAQIIRQNQNNNDAAFKQNLCASFQREAVDSLLEKVTWALREYPAKAIVVAGGVACNSKLRHSMNLLAEQNNLPLLIPSPVYCTDNAAMIAYVGSKQLAQNRVASLDLNAQASVSLDDFYNRRIEGVV
jgi:N6-L-threonylcarbamoyladenine synthase